ncbi:MAG: ribosomal protein S18-alanine N-acetyltransferase [Gemmatales bacterium]|nr:ribosomal protein S18-alanine N-acetyltransferase [Gemmatales bacterium]MCS7159353.1 ribosomal protein S18-alanine N-acetyltransferase [Gemmatales bacterium]MDW8174553.1 ribosomal protein S18-alanine N-acetyltransferase [Gemmatales bacterium]MDW8223861.1 ribosomal protein S18-alanine N-acetyltransferase [Gemmatales bacterium]
MRRAMLRGQPLAVQIRWMIKRDMPEVLAIEQASFDTPWTEEDFLNALRQRNCIGMVAETHEQLVGFIVYELQKSQMVMLNLAVHPQFRRRGIGRQLVERLISKLTQQRRDKITLEVRERNLPAQLFFKALGFHAVRVLREYYPDTGEDAYVMQYHLPEPSSQEQSRAA